MFKVNEIVFHKKIGVCKLKEITIYDGEEYYVFESNKDNGKIMIPKSKLDNLVRKLVTKEKLNSKVEKTNGMEINIIQDYRTRIKKYNELLKSGEFENILVLIKTIYHQKSIYKNLPDTEKRILGLAEELIFDEIPIVLGIPIDDVKKYI